jgi:hypothetical protein
VAGVTLNPIQPTAVDRHDGALHINEVVLAQTASRPFLLYSKLLNTPLWHRATAAVYSRRSL